MNVQSSELSDELRNTFWLLWWVNEKLYSQQSTCAKSSALEGCGMMRIQLIFRVEYKSTPQRTMSRGTSILLIVEEIIGTTELGKVSPIQINFLLCLP